MIPVLNEIGTHCAVFGNHDFGKLVLVFVFFFVQSKKIYKILIVNLRQ